MSGVSVNSRISRRDSVELQAISIATEYCISPEKNEKQRPHGKRNKTKAFFLGFISCVGIQHDAFPWHLAVILSVIFATLYWGVVFGSLYIVRHDFASFWAPSGVYIGSLLRSPPRARRLSVVTISLSLFSVNVAYGNSITTSLLFVGLNDIDNILTAGLCLALVRVVKPSNKINLYCREHLLCVGFGLLFGCAILINLSVLFAVSRLKIWKLNEPSSDYGVTYLRYFGRNLAGSFIVAPFILSFPVPRCSLRQAPNAFVIFCKTHKIEMLEGTLIVLILTAIPTLSTYLISGSALSTVAGLYVCYPAVLWASAKFGMIGASGSSLVIGIASAVSTLIFASGDFRNYAYPTSHSLSPEDQFVWIHLFLVVLVSTSLFFVVILHERDTARTNIEIQVHERTEELTVALTKLDEARRKAETADNDKAVFFSFLCHELRNPLHVISNMINALEDNEIETTGNVSPEVKAVKSSSKYMLALVSDVLDLGRFEAGRVVLEELPVDVQTLLRTNLDTASHMAHSHRIHFDYDIDENLPNFLKVDAIRLQQVFNNFISNAFKFTPKGGHIHVEVRAIGFHTGEFPVTASTGELLPSLSCREPSPPLPLPSSSTTRSRSHAYVSSPALNFSTSSTYVTTPVQPTRSTSSFLPPPSSSFSSPRRPIPTTPDRDDYSLPPPHLYHSNLHVMMSSKQRGWRKWKSWRRKKAQQSLEAESPGALPIAISSDHIPDEIDEEEERNINNRDYRESGELIGSSSTRTSVASTTFPPGVEREREREREGQEEEQQQQQQEIEEEEGEKEWVIMEVSVEDTGIGIDPSIVSKLFRPYAQAAVSTMREYGGSGLGLAITNQIVRLMGGTVSVDTEIGKGSKFTFTVPLQIIKKPQTTIPYVPPAILSPLSPGLRHATPLQSPQNKHPQLSQETILEDKNFIDETIQDQISIADYVEAHVLPSDQIEEAETKEKEKAKEKAKAKEKEKEKAKAKEKEKKKEKEKEQEVPIAISGDSDKGKQKETETEKGAEEVFQILIVDDSSVNRNILKAMLQRLLVKDKFVFDIATNGLEAVEKCAARKGKDEYKLIFMDIVMPIMDGLEACRQIRSGGYTNYIVITTANQVTGGAAAAEIKEVGANEAISKPFSKEHILNILRKYGAGNSIKT